MASRSVSAFAESVTVAALEDDPYPIYARLRREAPVCFIPAVGLWFVTRYDDVDFVGTHPELFTAELDDSPVDRTFGSPTIGGCPQCTPRPCRPGVAVMVTA